MLDVQVMFTDAASLRLFSNRDKDRVGRAGHVHRRCISRTVH